jgi:hypothetical protein
MGGKGQSEKNSRDNRSDYPGWRRSGPNVALVIELRPLDVVETHHAGLRNWRGTVNEARGLSGGQPEKPRIGGVPPPASSVVR